MLNYIAPIPELSLKIRFGNEERNVELNNFHHSLLNLLRRIDGLAIAAISLHLFPIEPPEARA